MKMRLIVALVFLVAMTAGVADAEWASYNVNPQPFQISEDGNYVIAVGTEDKLEPVKTADIINALQDGKEIRLRYAEVLGDISFHGKIEIDVYFIKTTFQGEIDFSSSIFSKVADFGGVMFSKGSNFTSTVFLGGADFGRAKFSKMAMFLMAKFLGEADFHSADFLGDVDFMLAIFSDQANFEGSTFSRDAYFVRAIFLREADFSWVTFSGVTHFNLVRLSERIRFWAGGIYYSSRAKFEKEVFFSFKSLEGHIVYDQVFFRDLIKHYQNIGWLELADDAYYLYRYEKARQSLGILSGLVERIFLELPFGYGVKPWILLRSFLILWLAFGFYYVGFLRRPGAWWFGNGIKPWNPFRDKCRCFFWAAIHSLNILTPGIDLQPMRFIKASQYELVESESKRLVWVQRVQQLLGWYLLALFLVMFGKIWVR